MTYKDTTIIKEHSRLTVKIKRWKAQGKDISELLAQREALKEQTHKKDITDITLLDPTFEPNQPQKDITKDTTQKDITLKKTDQKNYHLLTKISVQLETVLNLVREPKKEPNNYDDLFAKIHEKQQEFFNQLEKSINEKINLVKTDPKPIFTKTKKQPKTKEKPSRLVSKEQPLKVDLAELEKETGLTKDWKNPAWNRAWKIKYNELYNQLPSTLEKKRQWARENGGR